jgi:hypothetical protein
MIYQKNDQPHVARTFSLKKLIKHLILKRPHKLLRRLSGVVNYKDFQIHFFFKLI